MPEGAVITGAAVVTALGWGLDRTWDALCAGASGIGPVKGFDASAFPCAVAAQVTLPLPGPEDPGRRDEAMLGRHGAMLLHTSRLALADAGIDPGACELDDTGFFAAMGMVDPAVGDLEAALASARRKDGVDLDRFLADGYRMIHPLWPLSMLNNVSFCIVSTALGVRGENAVFSPGADGVVAALGEAAALVTEGRAPRAMVAGVSAPLSPMALARVHLAASERATGTPRPPGEGCGVLVVEDAAVARSRNARVRAVAAGWSSAAGGGDRALDEAMQWALGAAGLACSDVGAVMLHAGPTLRAKEEEQRAVRRVIGDRQCVETDTKGAIGHLGAGAGAVDACLALRILETGRFPDGAVDQPRRGAAPGAVMVNAHGDSGQRAAMVLKRAVG